MVKNKLKVLIDGRYRTTPTHVFDILHDFILRYPLEDSPIPDLEVGESKLGNHEVYYTLGLGRFRASSDIYFSAIGGISIQPVNDVDAWVKITGHDIELAKGEDYEKEVNAAGARFVAGFSTHFRKLMRSDNDQALSTSTKAQSDIASVNKLAKKAKANLTSISKLAEKAQADMTSVSKPAEKAQADLTTDSKPAKTPRSRDYRVDTIRRVALAFFLQETEHLSRRAAALKAHTTTNAMKGYEKLDDVKVVIDEFKRAPESAKQFQMKLRPRTMKKGG